MIWIEPRGKKASGETWVLNHEIEIKTCPNTNISFTSAETEFSNIRGEEIRTIYYLAYYKSDGNVVFACEDNSFWEDEAYRTVTFHETPPDVLLAWLQSNAVKQ